MALKPGTVTVSDFEGSMAEAMKDALQHHWPREMGGRPIPFGDRFLRLLFVAISQGVVRHLKENPDAFKLRIDTEERELSRIETTEDSG